MLCAYHGSNDEQRAITCTVVDRVLNSSDNEHSDGVRVPSAAMDAASLKRDDAAHFDAEVAARQHQHERVRQRRWHDDVSVVGGTACEIV